MTAFLILLTALGWSLLNSIWQMALMWVIYFLLTAGNKRFSAAGKYNMALVFIFIGTEWFVYSLIHLINEPALPFAPGFIPVSAFAIRWMPYGAAIYLLILMVRFLQYGFQYVCRNKNNSGRTVSPLLQSFTDRHARLLGITKQVHVFLSDMAETAETSGFLKPLILLPITLVTRLTPQQLEAILVHELFHIRRNDFLINIFMSAFHCIFFFNPFASLFYNALLQERELACDDGVLEMNYPPALYAEALFNLEKFRRVKHGFSIPADGNRPWLLMDRIRRVLGKPVRHKNKIRPLLLFSMISAFVLSGLKQNEVAPQITYAVAASRVLVLPARYESVDVKIKINEKKRTSGLPVNRKRADKVLQEEVKPAVVDIPESEESDNSLNLAVFAGKKELRNFTNEAAAGLTVESIPVFPGTPYIPSASLSYEDLPDNLIQADSIQYILIQKGIQDMIDKSRMKTTASLNELKTELEVNKKQLKGMEMKNRQLIRLHEKNIQSFLEKTRRQLQFKKQEIEQLQIRLRISGKEIIHI